jgi:hypothetical protein
VPLSQKVQHRMVLDFLAGAQGLELP